MTSIEWLFNELWETPKDKLTWHIIFKKAKEMHKQEIINTYRDGRSDQQSERPSKFYNRMSEQYYQETFKKD